MRKFIDKYLISRLGLQIFGAFFMIIAVSALTSVILRLLLSSDVLSSKFYSESMRGFFQLIDTPREQILFRRELSNSLIAKFAKIMTASGEAKERFKTYRSAAILCCPAMGLPHEFMTLAYYSDISIIAVLPCSREEYELRFPEGFKRERIQQCLRNVFTYYVLDSAIVSKMDELSAINAFIAAHSDELAMMDSQTIPSENMRDDAIRVSYPFLPHRTVSSIHRLKYASGNLEIKTGKS